MRFKFEDLDHVVMTLNLSDNQYHSVYKMKEGILPKFHILRGWKMEDFIEPNNWVEEESEEFDRILKRARPQLESQMISRILED